MEKNENDGFIVCLRKMRNSISFIEGARTEKCCECDNEVWLTPSTYNTDQYQRLKWKIICMDCLMANHGDEHASIEPPTKEQKEEFEEFFRPKTGN